MEVKYLRVRGHQYACGKDYAQADWAELNAIDDRCEGFPPRSIAPEVVANAIRHRQRCWHLLWFQAGVLSNTAAIAAGSASIAAASVAIYT